MTLGLVRDRLLTGDWESTNMTSGEVSPTHKLLSVSLVPRHRPEAQYSGASQENPALLVWLETVLLCYFQTHLTPDLYREKETVKH